MSDCYLVLIIFHIDVTATDPTRILFFLQDSLRNLVKQLKLDYKVNKKRSLDSLGFYLKHLDQHFKGFKAIEIRTSDVLEYIAKRQEEGAANSSINRELSALKRAFSLARIAGI